MLLSPLLLLDPRMIQLMERHGLSGRLWQGSGTGWWVRESRVGLN
jgi:hypothetical protein